MKQFVATLACMQAFVLALVCFFRPPGAMSSLGLLLLNHDITHIA
jgi:hypothetical protein